jgi:outer membrane protein assembly factor BamB
LGRVSLDGDFPRGALTAADLDGNGRSEVVVITNSGRAVAVDVVDGKIKWKSERKTPAWSAAFADVNHDGALDVVLPGSENFAIALSGRDGSLIWKSDDKSEDHSSLKPGSTRLRSLTVLTKGGQLAIFGSDPSSMGLRGLEIH